MTRRNRSQKALQRRQWLTRRVSLVVGGLLAVLFVVSFFFGEMGVPTYLRMLDHARELEHEIQEMQRANAEMRVEIQELQHDPQRIEEMARELGLVRKGETVYQFIPEADAGARGE